MGEGSARIAFDQRIARVVARPLARTPLTPNAVTGLSIVVGLGAAWLFAQGGTLIHWGAGIFVVAVWMDHLDGELARLTGKTSAFGHYFDHVAAMINYVTMFTGAGIGLGDEALGGWALECGVAAGLAVAAIMTLRVWIETRQGKELTKMTVRYGFEVEDTLYVVAPITWLGLLPPFVVAAGIGAPLFMLYVIWEVVRATRAAPGTEGS